jgi:hypothetical protein
MLELERLEAGGDPWPGAALPSPSHRQRNFLVLSGILAVAIVAVLIWLFTFEETALTTLPQVTREVFVPLATPAP